MSRDQNAGKRHNLMMANKLFENTTAKISGSDSNRLKFNSRRK